MDQNLKELQDTRKEILRMTVTHMYPEKFRMFTSFMHGNNLKDWQDSFEDKITSCSLSDTQAFTHVYIGMISKVSLATELGHSLQKPYQTIQKIKILNELVDQSKGNIRQTISHCLRTIEGHKPKDLVTAYAGIELVKAVMPPVIDMPAHKILLEKVDASSARDIFARDFPVTEKAALARVAKKIAQYSLTMRQYSNDRRFWKSMDKPDMPMPRDFIAEIATNMMSSLCNKVSPRMKMNQYGIILTDTDFKVASPQPD